jgi:hypothetical protein
MIDNNARKKSILRPTGKQKQIAEEMSEVLKSDTIMAFNFFKNENGLISKLKLRTLLYSFVFYKCPIKEINEYINEYFPNKQEFSYDDVYKLVYTKL